jgi:hypothetical protein
MMDITALMGILIFICSLMQTLRRSYYQPQYFFSGPDLQGLPGFEENLLKVESLAFY